jgi:truncated hemoglobin YjbI
MGITEAQFGAMVEDLIQALDEAGVRPADRDELIGALGAMKGDIVGQ